jgi:hypothetical protein
VRWQQLVLYRRQVLPIIRVYSPLGKIIYELSLGITIDAFPSPSHVRCMLHFIITLIEDKGLGPPVEVRPANHTRLVVPSATTMTPYPSRELEKLSGLNRLQLHHLSCRTLGTGNLPGVCVVKSRMGNSSTLVLMFFYVASTASVAESRSVISSLA